MVGFTTPLDILSVDLEVSEQFLTNPGNRADLSQASRQGTTLRPGITLSAPLIPIYARAAIPIHIEPSPVQTYARVGAGLAFNFVAASVYIEADADFPLAGGSTTINGVTVSAPDAFSQQIFSAGAATVEDRKARMKLPVRFARIMFLRSSGASSRVRAGVQHFGPNRCT